MDVDDEGKETAIEATEVTDEKELENEWKAKPSWAYVPADEHL